MKTLVIIASLLVLGRTSPTADEEVHRPFIYYPAELEKYIQDPSQIAAHLMDNPQLGRVENDLLPQALARGPMPKYESLSDFLDTTVMDPKDIVNFIAADPRLPLLDTEKMKKILPQQYVDAIDVAEIMQNPDEKIPLLNAIMNSQRMEEAPTSCPMIEQKENCVPHDVQIPGQIPCWSPGEYDVDCPLDNARRSTWKARSKRSPDSAFGLCCFDGCRNTCLQKQCRMVNTSYTELEMQERCTDQEREECRDVPKTTCKEVCRDETVMVATEVPDQKCKMVTVQECREKIIEEEVCTEEEQPPQTYNNQCPPPPPNPTCDPQNPVNQCWSPGTPDVDCPRNLGPGNWTVHEVFAPCCFNGCENVCHYEPVDPCPTPTGAIRSSMTKKVGPKQCQHREVCKTVEKECKMFKACKMVQKACKKEATQPAKQKQNCHFEEQQVCKPVEVTRTKPAPAPVPMPTITTMPMPSVPALTAMPSRPSYSSYIPTAGVRYPTAPVRPYFVNGGHKAKGHFKSKGFKSKGFKSKGWSKGHHFSKRSTDEVEEVELSKRGDDAEFPEVTREKRHMKSKGFKSKGCKKGKGKGCGSRLPYPTYPIYPSNQYVLQPERVPAPVYTASTVDSEFVVPEQPSDWQWNFTGTWNPGNTDQPITFTETITQCTTEQVEVCDLLDVDEELPIDICEEEECFNTVDPECQTSEEVCEQVVECQETYIPVCQVCQVVKKPVQECRDKPEEQCEEVTKTVEVPQTIKKCGEECTDFVAKECQLVPFKECHPVEVEVEKMVPEQVCEWPQY